MIKVCGVRFTDKGRTYYFKCNEQSISMNTNVIVETERGQQLGIVVISEKMIDEQNLVSPLKEVVRVATNHDLKQHSKNLKDSEHALERARYIVSGLGLKMKLLDASYTFDRKQLLFNFLADERIDFRELLKHLAAAYKTRIELRQIGIRDKAKEIGGLGPCGRFLCCNSFLTDLNSVTINMAKNQALALNPTKINGVCGRLLCCLSYEDETYTELRKGLPNIGDDYNYSGKAYRVVDVDILKRKVTLANDTSKEVVFL